VGAPSAGESSSNGAPIAPPGAAPFADSNPDPNATVVDADSRILILTQRLLTPGLRSTRKPR